MKVLRLDAKLVISHLDAPVEMVDLAIFAGFEIGARSSAAAVFGHFVEGGGRDDGRAHGYEEIFLRTRVLHVENEGVVGFTAGFEGARGCPDTGWVAKQE